MHPSTVIQLKELPTASFNAFLNEALLKSKSVSIKTSNVAISGEIIPAPLAIPQMVTGFPAILTLAVTPFEKVSVVIIASEASLIPLQDNFLTNSGSAYLIFVKGNLLAIIPVEATRTFSFFTPKPLARMLAVFKESSSPFLPLKQLALPLLAMIALKNPPLPKKSLHRITGAAGILLTVNKPAPFAGREE
ncbi:MAG: hypothetical protein BWY16_00569 [Candidatus Omnitrophica bacterium ADurb.Bin205]|nr:MAG: hypothetical protein BWY16_00569 [Candidatus Omnitrophica bacterium ADurb.Bin205]